VEWRTFGHQRIDIHPFQGIQNIIEHINTRDEIFRDEWWY
jgi:hypothetical protein